MKEKVKKLPQDELLQLLASDGLLVKRPVLVNGDQVLVGFREEEWKEMLNVI